MRYEIDTKPWWRKRQSFPTRAALSTCGRAKSNFPSVVVVRPARAWLRIPMKADICSDSKRTPFLGNRTVVGAKRRSGCFINGCPNRVKIWPPVLSSFGAPLWGDGLWPSQKVPAPFIGAGGRAVVAALELRARAATGRHGVTDSPWPAQIGAPVTLEL